MLFEVLVAICVAIGSCIRFCS